MVNNRVRFGDNLKVLRGKAGMTQEELGEVLHVTRQTVSTWEKNIGKADVYMLSKIHKYFNISSDELLYGTIDCYSEDKQMDTETFIGSNIGYVRRIIKEGYYDIIVDDLIEYMPFLDIDSAFIMMFVNILFKKGYLITNVYGNGFGIYFNTQQETEEFQNDIEIIFDKFIHSELDLDALNYYEKVQFRHNEVKLKIIDELHENIFGSPASIYWIDEHNRIRGFGKNEEDCKKQALNQRCDHYTIIKEKP